MYVLHYSPDSASTIVRLVLEELGVACSYRLIDRENGELASPAYRAMHPLGKIPVLETPDGVMFETAAILLYLSENHPGLAPAPGSADRAAFLKWFFFAATNLHAQAMSFFYPDRIAGPDNAQAVMQHARQPVAESLEALEAMAATRPAWLSPDQPGILGYYVGTVIHWLASYDPTHPSYFRAQEFPALHRVLVALENRPAVAAVTKAEGLKPTFFTDPY